jgi:hypothetical protein
MILAAGARRADLGSVTLPAADTRVIEFPMMQKV